MEFVTIFTASNPGEAALARSRLEANGFMVEVQNEFDPFGIDPLRTTVGGVLVQVPEDQAADARALIDSHDPSAGED